MSATYTNPYDIVELPLELPPLVKALTQTEHDAVLTAEERKREQVRACGGVVAGIQRKKRDARGINTETHPAEEQ